MKLIEIADEPLLGEDRFIKLTSAECSEFIQKMRQYPLYRGLNSNKAFIKNEVRSDRKPRDTSVQYTVLINAILERKFGIQNIRNRCVFLTTDIHQAKEYGPPYRIWLPDGGKLIYNLNIEDFFADIIESSKFKIVLSEWCLEHGFFFSPWHTVYVGKSWLDSEELHEGDFREVFLSTMDTYDDLNEKLGSVANNLLDYLITEYPSLDDYEMTEYRSFPKNTQFEIMAVGVNYYYGARVDSEDDMT